MNQVLQEVAVVQAYTNHRTGKTPDMRAEPFLNNPIQRGKLHSAYIAAISWFQNNNGSIEQI